MHTGIREPHLLLAGNPYRTIRNLGGIIDSQAITAITKELEKNVINLFQLGESHYIFSSSINRSEWRQKVSRLYYAAYNVKRSVPLMHDGNFSTDSSDHKNIDYLPDSFKDIATYKVKLKNLRDDRNLADYSHLAVESDLLIPTNDAHELVTNFINDSRDFLKSKGVNL